MADIFDQVADAQPQRDIFDHVADQAASSVPAFKKRNEGAGRPAHTETIQEGLEKEGTIAKPILKSLFAPVEGVQQTAQGVQELGQPGVDRKLKGVSDIARGGMGIASPYIMKPLSAAPLRTILGLGAGTLATEGVQRGAEALGLPPGASELAGTVAGVGVGGAVMGSGGEAGPAAATELASAPPVDQPPARPALPALPPGTGRLALPPASYSVEPRPMLEPAAPPPPPAALPARPAPEPGVVVNPSGISNLAKAEQDLGPAAGVLPDRATGLTPLQKRIREQLGPVYSGLVPGGITEPGRPSGLDAIAEQEATSSLKPARAAEEPAPAPEPEAQPTPAVNPGVAQLSPESAAQTIVALRQIKEDPNLFMRLPREQREQMRSDLANLENQVPAEFVDRVASGEQQRQVEQLRRQQLRDAARPEQIFPDTPPSADTQAAEPRPAAPAAPSKPEPISPKMKDVSALRALAGSPDNVLSEIPEAKPIVDTVLGAEDQKEIFRAKVMRQLAALTKGLNMQMRRLMGELLDTAADPSQMTGLPSPRFGVNYPADIAQRAAVARQVLDQIHAQFPQGAPRSGGQVGYISNYLTHIWKTSQADSDIASVVPELWDNYFKRPFENIRSLGKRDEYTLPVDANGKPIGGPKLGVGRPSSRFVEARSGRLQDWELDVNRIFPAYVDSAAKVIYDLPAVKAAQEQGRILPEGSIARQLATDWVRHYAGYEKGSAFNRRWDRAISSLVGMTSRSVLFWSGQLQAYHLARVALNTYPNLGAKYFSQALGDFTKSPISAWVEARDAGLIPNATTPLAFKTKGQVFEDVGNIFGVADFIDRSLAYKGYLAKNLDAGMSPAAARTAAVRDAKAASIITSPARSTRLAQLGPVGRMVATYKQIPVRIIEQYYNIWRNATQNPQAAARLGAMIAGAVALEYGAGIKVIHANPLDAYNLQAPIEQKILAITTALLRGSKEDRDGVTGFEKALQLTAQWMIPGGTSVVNQVNEGQPSFLAKKSKDEQ